MMAERFLAGVIVLVCVAFLVRLTLPPARQQRFDAALRRWWMGTQARLKDVRQWRSRHQQKQRIKAHAEKTAHDAIERARRGVERDGNVIRPKAFKGKDERH
ncbi:MAG: hypothetical protein RJB60_431 [Pseudomonadota bacterium]|jgi:hypothetical protein